MASKRNKGRERQIAHQRIERLFSLARSEALRGKETRARRYVDLARRIGMRYNVRLPKGYKLRFCLKCGVYFVPPRNCRVRLGERRITITCLECGAIRRFPIGGR